MQAQTHTPHSTTAKARVPSGAAAKDFIESVMAMLPLNSPNKMKMLCSEEEITSLTHVRGGGGGRGVAMQHTNEEDVHAEYSKDKEAGLDAESFARTVAQHLVHVSLGVKRLAETPATAATLVVCRVPLATAAALGAAAAAAQARAAHPKVAAAHEECGQNKEARIHNQRLQHVYRLCEMRCFEDAHTGGDGWREVHMIPGRS